jgi:DNA-binding IclR family transcriptional regulator
MDTSSESQASDQQHEEELASAVLRYLAENPRAMDTLEGIAEWWIARQQIRVEVTTLARVLRRLTECGLLEVTGRGEYARYSLKPQRQDP